jgi:hypothetical protein
MLHYCYSQFIYIDVWPKFIQDFDKYDTLCSSLKHKENSVSLQPSNFILNLLIYVSSSNTLYLFFFLNFALGFHRFRLSRNECCNVQVRVQLLDPIIEDVEYLLDAPLLLVRVASYQEPRDALLDLLGAL